MNRWTRKALPLCLAAGVFGAGCGGGTGPGDTRVKPDQVNFDTSNTALNNDLIKSVVGSNTSTILPAYAEGSGMLSKLSPQDNQLKQVALFSDQLFTLPILQNPAIRRAVLPLLFAASGVELKGKKQPFDLKLDQSNAPFCKSGTWELTGLPPSLEAALLDSSKAAEINQQEITNAMKNGINLVATFTNCKAEDKADAPLLNGTLKLSLKANAGTNEMSSNFKFACENFAVGEALSCTGKMELSQNAKIANSTQLTYNVGFLAEKMELTLNVDGKGSKKLGADGTMSAKLTGTVDPNNTSAMNFCNKHTASKTDMSSYCAYVPLILGATPDLSKDWTLIVVADISFNFFGQIDKILEAVKLTLNVSGGSKDIIFAVYLNNNTDKYYLVHVAKVSDECDYQVTVKGSDGEKLLKGKCKNKPDGFIRSNWTWKDESDVDFTPAG